MTFILSKPGCGITSAPFISSLMFVIAVAGLRADETALPAGWSPALMMEVKRVGNVQVSPDARSVAFTVRETVMNDDKSEYLTHIHGAAIDGSSSRQLTRGDKSCEDPQWSPGGDWLAFLSSRGGKRDLWLLHARGGEAVPLTKSPTDITSFQWSPDGKWIAMTAVEALSVEDERRVRERSDVRVVDENIKLSRLAIVSSTPKSGEPAEQQFLATGEGSVVSDGNRAGRSAYDWSPDSQTIVFSRTRSQSPDDWGTADLAQINLTTGVVQSLAQSEAAESSPLFSPDGKSIAFLASDIPPTWGGTRTIRIISSDGQPLQQLAETRDGFGRYSELVGWSANGSQLYFTELWATSLKLLAYPLDGSPEELDSSDGMSPGGVSLNRTRTYFGFGREQLNRAPEAFVTGVDRYAPVQVSKANRDLPAVPLGRTEAIRWKSSGSQDVEGLLTYPVGYRPETRYPLLLVIHGGPMGAFTQTFDATPTQYPIAAFAAQGYVVLRPNPRGSSGYGRSFRYDNYGDWGGGDYCDVMAGVDHVIGLGVADPDRMGVMGWSYGGFMASWAITQTRRFKAASVGAGVTNLISFTGTADIPGFLPDYFRGEYWNNVDRYRAHSPIFQIQGVATPTLIQHGERDERVPLSQGFELYNALKRQGCVTKMVVYPRTPHGIEEPRLLLDCMQRNVEWFDQYVKHEKSSAPAP